MNSIKNTASFFELEQDYDEAYRMYDGARKIAERLYSEDENIDSKADLGTIYERLGNLLSGTDLLEKAAAAFRKIKQDTKTLRSKTDLYRCLQHFL